MAAKRVTLKAISERVGVSPVAVSAALGILSKNSQVRISEQKAKEIRKVAREMGYHTNRLARAFRTKRTNTIGILFRVVSNAQPVNYLIDRIHYELDDRGYQAYLCPYHTSFELLESTARRLVEWQVDGLILSHVFAADDVQGRWPDLEGWLDKVGVPRVLVESTLPPTGTSSRVNVDMFGASARAAERLIAAGHKHIAYVGEERGANEGRWQAIQKVATAQGIESQWLTISHPRDVAEVHSLVLGTKQIAATIAKMPNRPTGIVCVNDSVGCGLIVGLKDEGLQVPQDVAVIGYDNSEPAVLSRPQLTTFEQPIRNVANRVVEQLISHIENDKTKPITELFDATLVERESV